MIVLIILNSVLTVGLFIYFEARRKVPKKEDKELTEKLIKTETEIEILGKKIDALTPALSNEFGRSRKELSDEFGKNRRELNENLKNLQESNEKKLGQMRETVDAKLSNIQESNEKKLEKMRETVDEKLQASVERRFSESFKTISGQLKEVHQGLGEMKNLATGVGDLKKVMEGVKTRGIYGEVQLGAIIEDILTPGQYLVNTLIKKGSQDRVEYAVRMPGKETEVLLPIDSKFPVENYSRLIAAYDKGDKEEVEKLRKALRRDVMDQAKKIHDKYIEVPKTTEFAMMFVPTESLYAEILRIAGLSEEIREKYKISLVSPATLPVILNGLLMGYRSVAIEKRSAEVWKLLGGVKAQFGKFGDLLEGVQKKLTESANKIEDAKRQSRRIEKEMTDVEVLPEREQLKLGE